MPFNSKINFLLISPGKYPNLLGRNSVYAMNIVPQKQIWQMSCLKGISAEFQVIRGFSQKILADLLSYNKILS